MQERCLRFQLLYKPVTNTPEHISILIHGGVQYFELNPSGRSFPAKPEFPVEYNELITRISEVKLVDQSAFSASLRSHVTADDII